MAKLNPEVIQSAVNGLQSAVHTTVIESMTAVKQQLDKIEDANEVVEQLKDGLKKYQVVYNNAIPSYQATLDSFKEVDEVREALEKKVNVGEVRNVDASFQAERMDAGAIIP